MVLSHERRRICEVKKDRKALCGNPLDGMTTPFQTTMFHLNPGRLSITCLDAKNIRGRVSNDTNAILFPYLQFRLNNDTSSTTVGANKGHDVVFDNQVISFDIVNPESYVNNDGEVKLTVQLKNKDDDHDVIGEAILPIIKILTSTSEVEESIAIKRSGDTTSNSFVNLKFVFVNVTVGMLKLCLGSLHLPYNEGMILSVSTLDGQTNSNTLAKWKDDNDFDLWVDSKNWFGDLSVSIHTKGAVGNVAMCGSIPLIHCLEGTETNTATSRIPLLWNSNSTDKLQTSIINATHYFLESGTVHIQSIYATNIRDVSINSPGLTNPRVIVRSKGKAHENKKLTAPATTSATSFQWNGSICLPVVDEYTLSVECCEYDEISGELEQIGVSELSLLPLYKHGRIDTSIDLKHVSELGDTLKSGTIQLVVTFDHPKFQRNAAFPRDQPTMTSYVVATDRETTVQSKKNLEPLDDETFTDEDIRQAFNNFDLDKNGYIGAHELRHLLVFMGEHVTDEEVDGMIAMLDMNGDGQVSLKEFKAMAESDDPSKDLLGGEIASRVGDVSVVSQRRHEQADREVFSRCIRTCNIDQRSLMRMWDILRQRSYSLSKQVSNESFCIEYDGFCELMPLFGTTSESREIYNLIRNGGTHIDGRELIMSLCSFVDFASEEKCKLAFDMYDDDRSGFLSIDDIESMMASTHLMPRDFIKKRANTLMRCADTDQSGGITIDELIVAAEKFPKLLFPVHSEQ
jgi:Ca2+-binding EF-hand superfamily protein